MDGLEPGVYLLPRHRDHAESLRGAIERDFPWRKPAGCPDALELYQLAAGDVRREAGYISCQQAIAADGAFSLAMLGEFERGLSAGPWGYRALMTEAGLVGQSLYLGAEACGLQGTGIGCFFDDGLHELLGLRDHQYQVLYQFTVGRGLVDNRIRNGQPYPDRRG